ncbi:hypothetical protein FNF07_23440 [Trinickia caryophylli]|nr:hypothetical protein C0Z17_02450 [Trinickia caryophylli]TRX14257.1 hypothetical protein FNF07_23440 [Trinickia caryophylli]
MALLEPRNKNTEELLQQASALSADRRRTAGRPASNNNAVPNSQDLIDALNSTAQSWMRA